MAPPLIGFSVILLSETLFATGLLLSLGCMARLVRNAADGLRNRAVSWSGLRSSGLSIAVAVYVRPSWLLAAPCFADDLRGVAREKTIHGAGVDSRRGGRACRLWRALPWAYRNHQVTGHWVFTTLWVGASLYDGFNPIASGDSNLEFVDDERLSKRMTEYEVDQHYRAQATGIHSQHPGRARR